jgi:tRNA (cmo5U34)-methyltransferase
MTMTPKGNRNSTLENFDFQAPLYDRYQTHCVPKYEEMNAITTGFLAHVLIGKNTPRILDLGCGTGNTALAVKRVLPEAKMTCLDGSEEMAGQARMKLRASGSDDDCRVADLASPAWTDAFKNERFDGVVSVLVLEHLPSDPYRAVIGSVLDLLKPQGWFVVVEAYEGVLNHDLFAARMELRKQQAIEAGIITQAQVQEIEDTSAKKEKHYFFAMEDKKRWWIDAGFVDVQFVWQYYCVALLVGRKGT